jgi:hypothetical protein
MKRGLVIGLVAVLVLLAAVPMAMAALNDTQKAELEALYRQQHELRLRILDKKTEFGLIDPEDAQKFRERMQERWEIMQQRMEDGEFSFGPGKMGRRGEFGRMGRGGCGNCPRPDGLQNGPEL